MMAREVGYHGFGTAPLLSDSLFSEWFIIARYNPLESFFTTSSDTVTPSIVKRFNSAAERCYNTLIETRSTDRSLAAFSIQRFYRTVFMRAWEIQKADESDYHLLLEMQYGVELAIKMADKLLATATSAEYLGLYVDDPKQYRYDVLETLVEIVYEALEAISNRFKGVDDAFWMTAIEAFQKSFPSIGHQPDGMTPFQQRLSLKIIDKLGQNMRGTYPAICRVLLACVGPYEDKAAQSNHTAFNILKNEMYRELKRLPDLASSTADKIGDFLPNNVAYDAATTVLTHTYGGGEKAATTLSALNLQTVSLVAGSIRRQPIVACPRFRRHRVRCFHGTGGASWSGGSLRESSSLRLCA